jgi:hypothetical protein
MGGNPLSLKSSSDVPFLEWATLMSTSSLLNLKPSITRMGRSMRLVHRSLIRRSILEVSVVSFEVRNWYQ